MALRGRSGRAALPARDRRHPDRDDVRRRAAADAPGAARRAGARPFESSTRPRRSSSHNARTTANLVFLGDKGLLWNDARTAFVMYGVQGRTWVALGDPVGPQDEAEPLVKAFLERCDDYQGVPVFYEASKQWLHVYADFGLTFAKLGEEARVFLPHFALEGSGHKKLRTSLNRLGRERAAIRIVPSGRRPGAAGESQGGLRRLARGKGDGREGLLARPLQPDYIVRFPMAVVEIGSRVEAFATLWPSAGKQEISLDLMRFRPSAPQGTMDALFAWLLSWARPGRLPVVQSRDGAALGARGLAGVAALVETRTARVRLRRGVLQLPGTARLQGEVRSGLGAALPGVSGRPRPAARRHRRVGADRGRLSAHLHQACRVA